MAPRPPANKKRVTVASAREAHLIDPQISPAALPMTSRFRTHDGEVEETSGRHGGQPRHIPYRADDSEEPA